MININLKKLIAKEIIILTITILLIFSFYSFLYLYNLRSDIQITNLQKEELLYERQLDSILKLPRNANWNGQLPQKREIYNSVNSTSTKLDYTKTNTKEKLVVKKIENKLKEINEEYNNVHWIDINIKKFAIILLLIVYPIRIIFYILNWSIKILK